MPSKSPVRPSAASRTLMVALILALLAVACNGGETSDSADSASGSLESATSATTPTSAESSAAETTTIVAGTDDGSNDVTLVAQVTVSEVVARTEPAADADEVTTLTNPTDRGGPLVFQVVGPDSALSSDWLEVALPVRPNGTTGWIPADAVQLTANPYRIEVDIDEFALRVYRSGELELETPVAIGEGETPTPIGQFYLIELLKPSDPGGAYGPYAYGLSGFSDTLDSFNGGEGVIGIHGTNQPDALGTRVSHGCIRIANDVITDLAGFLPLGTPVDIA